MSPLPGGPSGGGIDSGWRAERAAWGAHSHAPLFFGLLYVRPLLEAYLDAVHAPEG